MIWDRILDAYALRNPSLKQVSIKNIPLMILGKPISIEKQFMSHIINGPYDVDKLDYLQRDGYFSGIQTLLDVDRLLITIGVDRDKATGARDLYTDISGATVLEQVMFNKMILFSSIYYHHKVRAAFLALTFLFDRIKSSNGDITINGLKLDSVVDYLRLDDRDILNNIHSNPILSEIIKDLKNRHLLKRALVLSPVTIDENSGPAFLRLQNEKEKREEIRRELCDGGAGDVIYDVFVDCPKPPHFLAGSLEAKVKLAEEAFVYLNKLYPVSGWVSGYAQYRYKGHIFAKAGNEEKIAKKAIDILRTKGLNLNDKAFTLAKQKAPEGLF